MANLKPCPFCGGTPVVIVRNRESERWHGLRLEVFVQCSCGCVFFEDFPYGFLDEASAVEAWNIRLLEWKAKGINAHKDEIKRPFPEKYFEFPDGSEFCVESFEPEVLMSTWKRIVHGRPNEAFMIQFFDECLRAEE